MASILRDFDADAAARRTSPRSRALKPSWSSARNLTLALRAARVFAHRPRSELSRHSSTQSGVEPGQTSSPASPVSACARKSLRRSQASLGILSIVVDGEFQAAGFSLIPSMNLIPRTTSVSSGEPSNDRQPFDALSISLNTIVRHAVLVPLPGRAGRGNWRGEDRPRPIQSFDPGRRAARVLGVHPRQGDAFRCVSSSSPA